MSVEEIPLDLEVTEEISLDRVEEFPLVDFEAVEEVGLGDGLNKVEEFPLVDIEEDELRVVTEADLDGLRNDFEARNNFLMIAGEAIAQYRLVCLVDGKAMLADARDKCGVLGMALHNVAVDGQLSVMPGGKIGNDSWSLDPGAEIFLGREGRIAQGVEDDFQVYIGLGRVISATEIYLNVEELIYL